MKDTALKVFVVCNMFCSSEQLLVFKGVCSIKKQIEDSLSTSFPVPNCRIRYFMYCMLKKYTIYLISTSKRDCLPQVPCSCRRYCWYIMNFISFYQNCLLWTNFYRAKGEHKSCLSFMFSIYNSDSLPCQCQI